MGLYVDAWNIIMERPLENEGLDRFKMLDTAVKYKEAIIEMARTDKELIKIRRKKKMGIRAMERELVDIVYNRLREREVNVNLEAFELIFEALRVEFSDEE